MTTRIKSTHETLNDHVQDRLGRMGIDPNNSDNSPEIIDACRDVATEDGFTLVAYSEQCELWEKSAGQRANLWIVDTEGVGFAPGGLGFDDQCDWAD